MNWFDVCSFEYEKVRPKYPRDLFHWINRISTKHSLLLDCGTGNGQAAYELANFFDKVLAIDISKNQLLNAKTHPKIEYKCTPVETLDLPNSSVDVIVSASAVHWFDLETFYVKCKEMLTETGLIIVWSYSWPRSSHEVINRTLNNVKNLLIPHFPIQTMLHVNEYNDLQFPFRRVDCPNISIKENWSIEMLLSFLSTWPSVNNYIVGSHNNFIKEVRDELLKGWPESEKIEFIFPLYIKAGINEN